MKIRDRGLSAFKIQYLDKGKLAWSSLGQEEDDIRDEVFFDYPEEYLVSIDGVFLENFCVASLILKTNRKTYGPFGNENGLNFSSVKEGVKIIGISGTADAEFVRSIGFYGISINE